MSRQFVPQRSKQPGQWLRMAAFLAILGIALYNAWQRQDQPAYQAGRSAKPSAPAAEEVAENQDREIPTAATITNQIIRDQDGRVVFRGAVKVGPTLDRIHRGEQLHFANDGSVFQNRERRLPAQPAGYYREYVHPTPGLSGPGPQRLVVGREGEIYYTPDHYRSFKRLDQP